MTLPQGPRPPDIARALGTWALSFVFLVALVVAIQGFRGTVSDLAPVSVAARDLKPNNGNARAVGAAVEIRNAPGATLTLLQLPVRPFQAPDLVRLRLDAAAVPEDVEVALLWARRTAPKDVHEQRLALTRERYVSTALLDQNSEWRGEITMVALGIKGVAPEPWRVARVTLDAAGTGAVARGILDDWTAFDKWDGRSINVMFGGREVQRLYLPLLAFAASAIALLVMRRRYARQGLALPSALVVLPFVAGWILLDIRWQAELMVKARETLAVYGGIPLGERHLRMADGDLYRTIGLATAKLPEAPQRVFVGSDVEYFLMRAAYHLYPHNVAVFGWYDGKDMRPGDFVFLYQKAGVRFDATHGALLWQNGSQSRVEALYVTPGAGLFRLL